MGARLGCCFAVVIAWAILLVGCPQFESDFVIGSNAQAVSSGDSEPMTSLPEAGPDAGDSTAQTVNDAAATNDTASSVSDDGSGGGPIFDAASDAQDAQEASPAAEAGPCSTGTLQCTGSQPQVCESGQWHNVGAACSNQACVGGACQGVCSPGATRCSGSMFDGGDFVNAYGNTQTCDPTGQWGANAPCSQPTPVCQGGRCTCPSSATDGGSAVCNGVCVNESSDSENCGACGHQCASGTSCEVSRCLPSCSCSASTVNTACGNAACAAATPGTVCELFMVGLATCEGSM